MSASILYISYDGLMEPLGQSQVLQYLKSLARQHSIALITYEKPHDLADESRLAALRAEVEQVGIYWFALTYHKRPSSLATAYDISLGLLLGAWLVLTRRVHIVHARSYVPSVIALCLKKLLGVRYIFDMRGFWADERVDGGIWPAGSRLYSVAKWFERRFLQSADTVVSLTRAGVDEINKFPYLQGRMPHFEVIPTCTNLALFYPPPAAAKDVRPFTLGYVGSVGTWYLLDQMIECFKLLCRHRPDARMLFVNRHEHDLIRQRLAALGVGEDCVDITSANHAGVVTLMHRMDAGILLIKPVFSKRASAPTKLGEFLGSGIPCLGNADVGDVESVLEGHGVGIVLQNFNENTMENAVLSLLELCIKPGTAELCRGVAEEVFSLEKGVTAYGRIYQTLS
jgi:glycosyltransferase involved in cell wall biosynthesis